MARRSLMRGWPSFAGPSERRPGPASFFFLAGSALLASRAPYHVGSRRPCAQATLGDGAGRRIPNPAPLGWLPGGRGENRLVRACAVWRLCNYRIRRIAVLVDWTLPAARDQHGLGNAPRHRNPPAGNKSPGMQRAASWAKIGGITTGHGGCFLAAILKTQAAGNRPQAKQQAREE